MRFMKNWEKKKIKLLLLKPSAKLLHILPQAVSWKDGDVNGDRQWLLDADDGEGKQNWC